MEASPKDPRFRGRRAFWWALAVLVVSAGAEAQGPPESVRSLYEEAQRYQLGTDRPADIRKAIDLYLRVIQTDPAHVDARYNLAFLCFQQKRYDLAARYYLEVVQLRPDDADALNNLGTVYERQGKHDAAMGSYRKAVALSPNLAAAHYNIARQLLDDGRKAEAREATRRALSLEPENEAIIKLNAQIEGELGRLSNTTVLLAVGGIAGVAAAFALLNRGASRKGRRPKRKATRKG